MLILAQVLRIAHGTQAENGIAGLIQAFRANIIILRI